MTITDYIVIVLFSLLILFIGLSFSKTSGKDMKSFFAAGGAVPWWINSLSLFMGFVSAGTFVVWGSIAYSSGLVAITIQWTMSIAGFLVGFLIAPKWHKTKSLTAAEYISNRLGVHIQKAYSYIYLCIVILFGDNGRPQLRDKQFLYEGGLKVPLIIRWPGKLKPGKVDEQLISLIDVTATSLAAAKIKVPKYLQGNVFIGKNAKSRQHVFGFRQRSGEAVEDMRSITDGHFKLIWNRMPEIPWMQMSGYKKVEYPAYALFYQLQHEGKLESPVNKFMALKKPKIE